MLNDDFGRNVRVIGDRLVINAFENSINKGLYACSVYNGRYSNNATILLDTNLMRQVNTGKKRVDTKFIAIRIQKFPLEMDSEKSIELVCNTGT